MQRQYFRNTIQTNPNCIRKHIATVTGKCHMSGFRFARAKRINMSVAFYMVRLKYKFLAFYKGKVI